MRADDDGAFVEGKMLFGLMLTSVANNAQFKKGFSGLMGAGLASWGTAFHNGGRHMLKFDWLTLQKSDWK